MKASPLSDVNSPLEVEWRCRLDPSLSDTKWVQTTSPSLSDATWVQTTPPSPSDARCVQTTTYSTFMAISIMFEWGATLSGPRIPYLTLPTSLVVASPTLGAIISTSIINAPRLNTPIAVLIETPDRAYTSNARDRQVLLIT